jgi:hypothetical protein
MEASEIMVQEISKLTDAALAQRWFELAGYQLKEVERNLPYSAAWPFCIVSPSGKSYAPCHTREAAWGSLSGITRDETACFGVVVPLMFATPCKDGDHFCLTLQAAEYETTAIFHHPLWSEGDDMFEHYQATAKSLPRAIVEAAVRALEVI